MKFDTVNIAQRERAFDNDLLDWSIKRGWGSRHNFCACGTLKGEFVNCVGGRIFLWSASGGYKIYEKKLSRNPFRLQCKIKTN